MRKLKESVSSLIMEAKGDRAAELRRLRQISPFQYVLVVIDNIRRVRSLLRKINLNTVFSEHAAEFFEARDIEKRQF